MFYLFCSYKNKILMYSHVIKKQNFLISKLQKLGDLRPMKIQVYTHPSGRNPRAASSSGFSKYY